LHIEKLACLCSIIFAAEVITLISHNSLSFLYFSMVSGSTLLSVDRVLKATLHHLWSLLSQSLEVNEQWY
jgi:hypothetical protein